ncbi:uncharacterized protein sced [Eurosta solidaginis]|uniref:uncharacterized protein sced n=1 Tax=Eurosta solidaginis TaxID=178769 RepID=UPI003530DFFB
MENNEITMFMEVKLDIHNKRPDSLKFKKWSKCEVKIEGIKCLPSYLRLTITGCSSDDELNETEDQRSEGKRCICVSIIVPGVSISLAASRTKEFSYGLFWTQYRKQCYIYFALETDTSCRRHMRWIKKTIKNLELHRQLMLEQNRISRGPSMGVVGELTTDMDKENLQKQDDENLPKSPYSALGPLPNIPSCHDCNQSGVSQRISHISGIYEEIIEFVGGQPRLSRRVSRASIASGIYEEMQPTTNEFNAIDEESCDFFSTAALAISPPPPLPPLPPPRKRINTFDGQGTLGVIPRSNTNPESELAKKKKYKNVLDIIFGNGRGKRAESVSETQACSAEDIINSITPTKPSKDNEVITPIYANDTAVNKEMKPKCVQTALANSKRNSFSSPDLSKINYLDDDIALGYSLSTSGDLHLSNDSLNNICLTTSKDVGQTSNVLGKHAAVGLNVSEKIPNNFNFSAANCSSINLIGFNGAAIPSSNYRKNKILIDDLTGYCVMAPIKTKKVEDASVDKTPAEPISSGYSTRSDPSTSSSTADEPKITKTETKTIPAAVFKTTTTKEKNAEESAIYEQMLPLRAGNAESDNETNKSTSKLAENSVSTSSNVIDFTGNLYENLLAVKASQELEHQLPTSTLSTSTPTESPLTQPTVCNDKQMIDYEEDYYQTPRKSIVSVDDKIPSYYPNSCDTIKTRRHHTLASGSPQHSIYNTSPIGGLTNATVPNATEKCNIAPKSVGLRHLVTLKMRREHKDNLYISSPQNIIEQRQSGVNCATALDSKNAQKNSKTHKSIKAGALKIAEHVYAVKHLKEKNTNTDNNLNNNNETDVTNFTADMRARLQTELLHFAILQKIDFKFDDANSAAASQQISFEGLKTPSPTGQRQQQTTEKQDHIYENLMLQQNSDSSSMVPAVAATSEASPKMGMHQSCMAGVRIEVDVANSDTAVQVTDSCSPVELGSGLSNVKKFASLPRFKKIDFSPLRLRINNVLQRGQQQD